VSDDHGIVLASGHVAWPNPADLKRTVTDHAALRSSRLEGSLRMRVTVLAGALAPNQPGRVWVTTTATGEPPRNPRIEASPDVGIEIEKTYTHACGPLTGVIEVTARGHSGGLALHAKDDLGREGDWYGSLPIAPGAMHVDMPLTTEPGTVRATVTSASARTLAYIELDDDMGRAEGHIVTLTGEPPHAEVTLTARTPGQSFVVVSGEPDGASNIAGATRAMPLWVGPRDKAPCESDLAELAAHTFPRFVALDGFHAKRAALGVKRKRGRLIALGALTLGSLVETLLLLRAAREGRRAPTAPKRSALDILVVLMLSLLGFVLLFALIEWTSR
jgi:hypothetical protein